MAAVDYIGPCGLEAAALRWDEALAPYRRRDRPLGDRLHCALLVMDLQRYFCDRASPAFLPAVTHIVPRVRRLAASFRAAGSPVVFTRHALGADEHPGRMADWWRHLVRDGEPWATLDDAIGLASSDRVIRKSRYDALDTTELGPWLAMLGVDTLVVCGVMTHLCCESTARGAFSRGLHVWVALDATASLDEELHLGALRALAHGFAVVANTDRIVGWRNEDEPQRRREPTAGEQPLDRLPSVERAARVGPLLGADEPRSTVTWPAARDAAGWFDLAVLGAGPAGLAAAHQALRHDLDVIVLEPGRPGGLLHDADWVENHPGSAPLSGQALSARLRCWAEAGGVRFVDAHVERLTVHDEGIELDCSCGERGPGGRARSRFAVVATGTTANPAEFDGEQALAGSRVFHRRSSLLARWPAGNAGRVVIIGGGDAAFDQGVGMLRRGWRVLVLVRGPSPRALALLQRRFATLGGEVWLGATVTAVREVDGRAEIQWQRDAVIGTLRAECVLVAVGRRPQLVPIDDARTVRDGPAPVLLVGDVRRGPSRQSAIALGDGIAAAMEIAARLGARSAPSPTTTHARVDGDH